MIAEIATALRENWKVFLGIHVAANVVSIVVLVPLCTMLAGLLILTSGDVALTDEDILMFAMSPVGFLAVLLIAALFMTLLVFEQAAMFLAGFSTAAGRSISTLRLGYYLLQRLLPLFGFALRLILRALLVAAPFVAVAALIFFRYLTDFDINFYLAEKPPVLWWAGSAIVMTLFAMFWPLMRVLATWVVSFPLLLVENSSPREAVSRGRTKSAHLRSRITFALLAWLLLNAVLFAIAGWLFNLGVQFAAMVAGNSLQAMAYLMGSLLVCWAITNVLITFFSSAVLSLGILHLYRRLFSSADDDRFDQRLVRPRVNRSSKVSAAALATLLLFVVVGAGFMLKASFDNIDPGQSSEIIAHRGASFDAPENTLAAVEEAIRQGADWVEVDAQETREGEIVVIHDRDLMKVGGSPLTVWGATLSELQGVDIGSRFDAKFSAERVPTLQQLLETCRGRIGVNIELKYYGQETRFEERVVRIVEAMNMQDDIVAMSLNYAGVQKLRSLRPDWTIGLLSSVAIGDLTQLDADFFAINGRFASRRFIRHAHDRERGTLVWTINDPVQMSAMMSKGVDGIITDRPGLANEVRAQRGKLSVVERFMIQFASLFGGRIKTVQ